MKTNNLQVLFYFFNKNYNYINSNLEFINKIINKIINF